MGQKRAGVIVGVQDGVALASLLLQARALQEHKVKHPQNFVWEPLEVEACSGNKLMGFNLSFNFADLFIFYFHTEGKQVSFSLY